MRALLENGAGWTALMTAAEWGHADIVAILLDRGADRKATNAEGETALDRAKAGGDVVLGSGL